MKLNEHNLTPCLDWAYYEEKALTMTDGALAFARADAFAAAIVNPETEGLYYDELSVYAREQDRRKETQV